MPSPKRPNSKAKYTDKQKRMAEHIADGYRQRGESEKRATARAWATVNKIHRGGEKPGGNGFGKPVRKPGPKRTRKA